MMNEGFLSLAGSAMGVGVMKIIYPSLLNKFKNELAYTYSKFQAFRNGHIIFTGKATGKRYLLKKKFGNSGKTHLNCKKLSDTYIPQHSPAMKTALKNKKVRLSYHNLFKLVEYKRDTFIPQIKQSIDTRCHF